MSKAEKTKAYIIEKSAPIFNMKGYAGTSLNDITEATGLTKGAIYGNFSDKNAIALAAYKYNGSLTRRRMEAAVDSKENAIDKLLAFTASYWSEHKRVFANGGCPILNTAIEADDNNPLMKRTVQVSIKWLAEFLANIIELGKKQNQVNKSIDAMEYAHLMLTLLEGGIMMAKVNDEPAHLRNALNRIDMIINKEIKK
jgi:TetR/AcrR family transcriptional repressor of nem operon